MYKKLGLFIAAICLAACNDDAAPGNIEPKNNSTATDTVEVVNNADINMAIAGNTINEIDSSGIVLFPLSANAVDERHEAFSSGSYTTTNYWNIIFFNSRTNDYHLLSDQKMIITSYGTTHGSKNKHNGKWPGNYLWYNIITTDYNRDGKLSPEDPAAFFISDREGNQLRQLSPPNTQLQSWQYVEASNKMIIAVRKDADRNHLFNEKDEVSLFEMNPYTDSTARPIFSNEFTNKIKHLFRQQWQLEKK